MQHIRHRLPVVHLVLLALLLCLAQTLARSQNIYSYGFENGYQGWSVDNGVWVIGTPPSGQGPGAAFDGAQCAFTTGPGGNYPANVSSRLVSPPITLLPITAGKQQITLTFWQWFLWGSGFFGASTGDVQVSTWNGTAWSAWTTVGTTNSDIYSGSSSGNNETVWSLTSVDLSAYAGKQIQIGFQHNGDQYLGPGWYIDDVSIDRVAIQPLPLSQTFTNFSSVPGVADWFGWSADNGVWQIGTPQSQEGPGSAFDVQSAATGLSDSATYPANQSSRLITPPMILPSIASTERITLTFWQWFLWGSGFFGASTGDVQVSTWNGTAWSAWTTVSNPASGNSPYSGSSGGWDLASVDLSAYAGKQIQVGFQHNGDQYLGPGWYIDDVSIVKEAIPYLPLNQTIGFENFSSTPGASDWFGWSVDNGVWVIGTPPSGQGPGAAHDGAQCAYTTGPGGNYPANQSSRLVTPSMILPSITSNQHITLTFWQWFLWGSGFFGASTGDVQVSTWNGTAWSAWTTVSNQYSGSSSGIWDLASVDLSAYAGKQIQVGFQHNGDQYLGPGWYIDDITVQTPAPVPVITGISPTSTDAGGPTLVLTIKGSNFTSASVVNWNFSSLTPNTITFSKLTVTIPASLIASRGKATISVTNPPPGGGTSNSKTFTILQTTLKLISASLSQSGTNYSASITLKNAGYLTAQNVTLTRATLNKVNTTTPLPVALGNIAAGATGNTTLTFPLSAGTSGQTVTLAVSGTFTGGSFTGSLKVILP